MKTLLFTLLISLFAITVFTSEAEEAAQTADEETEVRPEELDIRFVDDDKLSIHTAIVIDAPAETVWTTLTDFEAMSMWSTTFQGIDGELVDGANVTATFQLEGNAIAVPHTLLYSEGEYYGWSDPMFSVPDATDHHLYTVEDLGDGQTQFIQSDIFTGGEAQGAAGLDSALLASNLYVTFNRELKVEAETRHSFATAEIVAEITTEGDEQLTVYTSIVINATPAQVWAVLTDFATMPTWSDSFQGIHGELQDGAEVTTSTKIAGTVIPGGPRELIYEEGEFFGWSHPIIFDLVDNHIYRVEDLDDGRTLFIQSDTFTGEAAQAQGVGFGTVLQIMYSSFNQQLKAEVESRF
ncbi:MAG: SRPBCC family protein [Chloroflexota bacterium]